MASAAEQLAANLNFRSFAKAEELKKRLWFTLGALIVYRLLTYVPLPGIDLWHWGSSSNARKAACWTCSTCFPAEPAAHVYRCAEYHAVYFGIDHHAAPHLYVAEYGAIEKRG
ncbi:hypothetical protein JCM17845_25830 [Iodidimonas gelatinilytica]|uniref:Uncharacterized protein n=1 Tax=Iodidimonas gelatinilytica TaxID=1236966 RepID=A0A5A7N3L5_9PROT|nr:hypothetical protein JCM17845_25830 [Iodidimonas gelatinilytica]